VNPGIRPWSRAILENLTGPQSVKEYPGFYGTRRFITVFVILSQSTPVPVPPSYLLKMYFNIILLSKPRSYKWSLSLRCPNKTLYVPLFSPIHATCTAHLILLYLITRVIFGEQYRSQCSLLFSFIHTPLTLFLCVLCWNTFNRCYSP
jgi:hypothetical protein